MMSVDDRSPFAFSPLTTDPFSAGLSASPVGLRGTPAAGHQSLCSFLERHWLQKDQGSLLLRLHPLRQACAPKLCSCRPHPSFITLNHPTSSLPIPRRLQGGQPVGERPCVFVVVVPSSWLVTLVLR